MMASWGDTKRFIFEDILVYTVGLILTVTADFWINLATKYNFYVDRNLQGHPYDFGALQMVVGLFCVIQLCRKYDQWKYYK